MTKEAIIEAYKLGRELAAEEFNEGVKMAASGQPLSAKEMIFGTTDTMASLEKSRNLPVFGRGLGVSAGISGLTGGAIGAGLGALLSAAKHNPSQGVEGLPGRGAALGASIGALLGALSGSAGYGIRRLLTNTDKAYRRK